MTLGGVEMSKFEDEITRFVSACYVPGGARRKDLGLANRENDKVRQAARKRGLVVYEDRGDGARWFAVPASGDEDGA